MSGAATVVAAEGVPLGVGGDPRLFDGACRFCRDCLFFLFMQVDSMRSIRVLLSEVVILLHAKVFSTLQTMPEIPPLVDLDTPITRG